MVRLRCGGRHGFAEPTRALAEPLAGAPSCVGAERVATESQVAHCGWLAWAGMLAASRSRRRRFAFAPRVEWGALVREQAAAVRMDSTQVLRNCAIPCAWHRLLPTVRTEAEPLLHPILCESRCKRVVLARSLHRGRETRPFRTSTSARR